MPSAQHGGMWLLGTVREGAAANIGATSVSQEVWAYQVAAAAGALPLYEVGIGGTLFNGNVISIPNLGVSSQVALNIPAGSRLHFFSVNLEAAPTAITGGAINFFIGATQIATYPVVANSLTSGFATWQPTLAASQLQAMVGQADVRITAQLAGTAITGSLLAEISLNYTVRNPNGSAQRVR